MKKPFEKGERVTVYSTCYGAPLVTKGTIEAIAQGLLNVRFDAKSEIGNTGCWAHPRQCRRLIKKPRRRVWVNFYACGDAFMYASMDVAMKAAVAGPSEVAVEFIEVRRPK